MSKFKVGDRVRMYSFGLVLNGTVTYVADNSGNLSIETDKDGAYYNVHPKQCRKLISPHKNVRWLRDCIYHSRYYGKIVPLKVCSKCRIIKVEYPTD